MLERKLPKFTQLCKDASAAIRATGTQKEREAATAELVDHIQRKATFTTDELAILGKLISGKLRPRSKRRNVFSTQKRQRDEELYAAGVYFRENKKGKCSKARAARIAIGELGITNGAGYLIKRFQESKHPDVLRRMKDGPAARPSNPMAD